MDTDDESEIDDGEEEERVKRRTRSILRSSIRQGVVSATPAVSVIETEQKKKQTIDLKLPQKFDPSRVCFCLRKR